MRFEDDNKYFDNYSDCRSSMRGNNYYNPYESYRSQRRKRSRSSLYKAISLVMAGCFIASLLLGGALSYKLSADIRTLTEQLDLQKAEYSALKQDMSLINEEIASAKADTASAAPDAEGSETDNIFSQADDSLTYDIPPYMHAMLSTDGVSSITGIAKKVGPSIVGIRMITQNPRNWFFRDTSDYVEEGSGIIISKDGYIMTNYHVVQYADPKNSMSSSTTLEVFLPDERQAKAKFIGGDKMNDLAVIKIDLKDLPVAALGDSSKLEVGELAVAIGNPLGLEFRGSVTAGVVSALNRTVTVNDTTLSLIQTDAAINPGNSGGALVNSKGEVIGINTVKISVTGVEGLGFAIPINDAKPIVDQLIMFGYVKGRPYIGINGLDITETVSRQYGLPIGVYILELAADGGAANSGLKAGDVITSMAGKSISTMKDIETIKKNYKAGDSVSVTVVRNGKKLNLTLTFAEEK